MKWVASLICIALTTSCASRKPGERWPWTADSYAEDGVVYHGVGINF